MTTTFRALTLCCIACTGVLGSARFVEAQGFPPEEAAARMTMLDGFKVNLVAAEPMVRQPVAIEFDNRGRLWVVQYLQYPNPAGLKRLKVDRYSRTVYDRVPEPPPRGPKGADLVTILEDTDADGRAHKSHDFITGLNLASGIAFGHGGVYVLQVPYLLFYPDRNGNDVPDSDPEVLLSGFGMQDAHAVANSLTWGPDGWLYGCEGSTVTSRIDNIEFQQGVWRYHPLTKRFELFCEGGGNSWGLDFDRDGNLIYSTNFSPYRMLHGVQGGYYWKSFGKHGALHNPYAYGYFDHVPHTNFQGGHVTVGGVIYQGNSFPAQYRGKYLNADTLGHAVYWNDIEPLGSSFRSINGPKLLTGNDTWFAPDDVTIGPDGAAYISDWYDKRTAHPDPDADWDRSNGRIYRIQAKGAPPYTPPDVSKLPSDALVTLLSDPNNWLVDRARRVLADRRDANVIPRLTEMVFHSADDHLALEAFWALYVSGGFNDAIALQTLEHRNPAVRRWTVRLLGDERKVSSPIARRLAELAANDTDVLVRSQLASTAKRLPATDGLPIVERLLVRDEDANDPHVPLLLWWAVEAHAIESRDQVMSFFTSPEAWKSALSRDVVLVRLVRRYAAEGTESSLGDCARLIDSAPSMHLKRPLIASLDEGLSERTAKISAAPISLKNTLAALLANEPSNPAIIRPLARLGDSGAQQRAATLALDPKSPDDVRVSMLEIIGEAGQADLVPGLLNLLKSDGPRDVQIAALAALKSFDSAQVTSVVLGRLPQWRGEVGARAGDLLLSRQASAAVLLQAIDAGTIPVAMVTSEQVRQVSLYGDRRLDGLVRKHWGNMQQSSELKLAEIRRLNNDLNAAAGDAAAGKVLFQNTCAVCHHLYDFGADVGPDLTHANRKDRDFLLLSIVDPSATIRSEYLSYIIHTTDGQVLTGLIGAQTPSSITLKGPANQRTTIERAKIKDMQESPVSLMPEGLLSQLKPQQVRDLFAYLQGDR